MSEQDLREACAKIMEERAALYRRKAAKPGMAELEPGYSEAEMFERCAVACEYGAADIRTAAPALPVDAGEGRAAADLGPVEAYIKDRLAAKRAAAPQPPGVSLAPDALAVLKEAVWLVAREVQELNPGSSCLLEVEACLRAAITQAETGKAGAREALADLQRAGVTHVTMINPDSPASAEFSSVVLNIADAVAAFRPASPSEVTVTEAMVGAAVTAATRYIANASGQRLGNPQCSPRSP